jgi:hypothetical protein
MKQNTPIKKLSHGLHMGWRDHEFFLALNEEKQAYLFLVTLTRNREDRDAVVSQYHVIAESEEGAIAQVEKLAYPEHRGCCLEPEQLKNLTATATRIPMYIRGWGTQTF